MCWAKGLPSGVTLPCMMLLQAGIEPAAYCVNAGMSDLDLGRPHPASLTPQHNAQSHQRLDALHQIESTDAHHGNAF